jgi:uncharacterized protein YjbJ (UPF0337 family)
VIDSALDSSAGLARSVYGSNWRASNGSRPYLGCVGATTPVSPAVATDEIVCMNKLQLKGDWNIAKGKLKQRWANLTDDDLRYEEGMESELVGRIQKRTGQSQEQIEKAVEQVFSE